MKSDSDQSTSPQDERWIDTTWIFYARWHGPLDIGDAAPAYATVVTKDGTNIYFGNEAAAWLRSQLGEARR